MWMEEFDSEVEAFKLQQLYSPEDVERRIENSFRDESPHYNKTQQRPSYYGIEEMVKHVYLK